MLFAPALPAQPDRHAKITENVSLGYASDLLLNRWQGARKTVDQFIRCYSTPKIQNPPTKKETGPNFQGSIQYFPPHQIIAHDTCHSKNPMHTTMSQIIGQ